jgi:dipicolinate synthase subunit A
MKKILILGGDKRQIQLYQMMNDASQLVKISGFELALKDNVALDKHISDADIVFLPIPIKIVDGFIHMPFSNIKLTVADVVSRVDENAHIYFGAIDEMIANQILKDHNGLNFLSDEKYLLKNADLTAQAALGIAMLRSEASFRDLSVCIIGYGRIGKQLAGHLLPYQGKINICSRSKAKIAHVKNNETTYYNTKNVVEAINNSDIVFNTAPKRIIENDDICSIKKSVKIFELASKPYGIDIDYAVKNGVEIKVESGLPGRFFPKSAGKIIFETFNRVMESYNGTKI